MRAKINREDFKKLLNLLNELILASESGSVIIVEGRGDEEALRNIGIRGRISMASTMSDADIIDSLLEWGYGESNPANDVGEPKEVIILTDWDKEGKLMERNLNKKLKAFGFRVNVEFRKKLFNIVGRDVKTVEDLPKFIESFEKW